MFNNIVSKLVNYGQSWGGKIHSTWTCSCGANNSDVHDHCQFCGS